MCMSDDHLFMSMPSSFEIPMSEIGPLRSPTIFEFIMSSGFGGVVTRDPMQIVSVIEPPPMPDAPGVEALVSAGWRWNGYTFGRGVAVLDTDRVLAGRYAHRLPTNRRAKWTAAKARRRARKGCQP